jgi:hypothetical protein
MTGNHLIGKRVKVPMTTVVILRKEHSGNRAIGSLIDEAMSFSEPQSTETQFGSQVQASRNLEIRFSHCVDFYNETDEKSGLRIRFLFPILSQPCSMPHDEKLPDPAPH